MALLEDSRGDEGEGEMCGGACDTFCTSPVKTFDLSRWGLLRRNIPLKPAFYSILFFNETSLRMSIWIAVVLKDLYLDLGTDCPMVIFFRG